MTQRVLFSCAVAGDTKCDCSVNAVCRRFMCIALVQSCERGVHRLRQRCPASFPQLRPAQLKNTIPNYLSARHTSGAWRNRGLFPLRLRFGGRSRDPPPEARLLLPGQSHGGGKFKSSQSSGLLRCQHWRPGEVRAACRACAGWLDSGKGGS